MTTVRAPAKINLVLRVGPVRPDGFHRLATLFQALDLHDELEIEPAAGDDGRGVRGRHAGHPRAGAARRDRAASC